MNDLSTEADAVDAARALVLRGGRRILGLAGPPGSGKSTLAATLASTLATGLTSASGPVAVVVPMDGFHLAQCALERLGRAGRKGAPDTFDAAGFVALLRRLRDPVPDEIVWAPAFRREIEEPVAGAIAVPPDTPLVIVEGNYLLLDGVWAPVRGLLDESWHLATPDARRTDWLLARHMRFNRDRATALDWIERTDAPNARLIEAASGRADRQVGYGSDSRGA